MARQKNVKKSHNFFSADRQVSFLLTAVLLVLGLSSGGCSTATTFRVLDAATRQPIEGAVALVTWEVYRGLPGMSYTYGEIARAVEAVSDRNGYFTIPAVYGRAALHTPLVQVYKPGYVGWNSRKIYLGFYPKNHKFERTRLRSDFHWKNQDIFLQPWPDDGTMNHASHSRFLQAPSHLEDAGLADSIYEKAVHAEYQKGQWENVITVRGHRCQPANTAPVMMPIQQ